MCNIDITFAGQWSTSTNRRWLCGPLTWSPRSGPSLHRQETSMKQLFNHVISLKYMKYYIYLDVLSCITLIYSFFSSYWYHRKQRCYDSVWLREFATEEAVQRGAGDGWLDVLPISPCPAPLDQNVVVDVSPLAPRNWLRNTAVKKKWRKSPMAMLQCWIKYGRIW